MNGKAFVDTNVLVYLFDGDAPQKQQRAREVLSAEGAGGTLVLSTQVLQEFYVSVTRKLGVPLAPSEAIEHTRRFATLPVVLIDTQLILAATRLSRDHKISLWDALILRAAETASCERLLTEDLQDGWSVLGVTVKNPFQGL